MTPRIETRDRFVVLGVSDAVRRGSETPGLFARIWKTFELRHGEIRTVATGRAYYGVSFPTAEVAVTDYVAGMMVPPDTAPPEGLTLRAVPGGTYAVFDCPVDAIGSTYQHIFGTWLAGAPVQLDQARPSFEQYPEDVAVHPVGIHIPVRPKHE
jgi:predicted transcriptional regulator YdeE